MPPKAQSKADVQDHLRLRSDPQWQFGGREKGRGLPQHRRCRTAVDKQRARWRRRARWLTRRCKAAGRGRHKVTPPEVGLQTSGCPSQRLSRLDAGPDALGAGSASESPPRLVSSSRHLHAQGYCPNTLRLCSAYAHAQVPHAPAVDQPTTCKTEHRGRVVDGIKPWTMPSDDALQTRQPSGPAQTSRRSQARAPPLRGTALPAGDGRSSSDEHHPRTPTWRGRICH
jgi:hypothetical protein